MTDDTAAANGDDGTADSSPDGAPEPAAKPRVVCKLDTPEAKVLADLAMVFDDLQYVLLCCEQLVTAICGPATAPVRIEQHNALVEALWTGALVGYTRAFSVRGKVLTETDLTELELEGEVLEFHGTIQKLRDMYASRHENPRDVMTVGVALTNDGDPHGVAVTSAPKPLVDDTTVRQLGRIAYALSGLVDARMAQAQKVVLEASLAMPREELHRLPQVQLTDG